jgi:hypothetical protein
METQREGLATSGTAGCELWLFSLPPPIREAAEGTASLLFDVWTRVT